MSCFMTGGPGKEHGTNTSSPTGRIQEKTKGGTTSPTYLPESSSLKFILAEQHMCHQQGAGVRMTGQNIWKLTLITIESRTVSQEAEQ